MEKGLYFTYFCVYKGEVASNFLFKPTGYGPMSHGSTAPPPHHYDVIIQQEIDAYKGAFISPDPSWPVDVKVFLVHLNKHLFDAGLTIGELQRQCGLRGHDISTRFAAYMKMPPGTYRLKHRMELAKRLLRHERLKPVLIYQLVLAAGYERHDVFSRVFKRQVGCTPSQYRAY